VRTLHEEKDGEHRTRWDGLYERLEVIWLGDGLVVGASVKELEGRLGLGGTFGVGRLASGVGDLLELGLDWREGKTGEERGGKERKKRRLLSLRSSAFGDKGEKTRAEE
jgi:hypothetical protein